MRKEISDRNELKFAKEPSHSFFRRSDPSAADEPLDPGELNPGRIGIKIRWMGKDQNGMPETVHPLSFSLDPSVRKYPQSPSAADGKVPNERSHDQGRKFLDFTVPSGDSVRVG
jgi:hypothetical protein